MTVSTFTHLHLHTEYSLLDGAIRIKELPERLSELGMEACAITDHGVLYGVIDFYNAMIEKGLKPIIGCEVYVAPRSHLDKEVGYDKEPAHLVLLAENMTGYKNLMKLVSVGFTEGFYYKPRIDRSLLAEHAEGLIALSACLGGEIPQAVLQQQMQQAKELAVSFDQMMGRGNFYLELQHNGLQEQNLVNSALIKISRETGIPLVATNDCHYLKKEDARAHDVLLCMQTGKRVHDEDRMRMESDAFYVKSPQEMAEAFADVPEALANTAEIAARCQVAFSFDEIHLPAFQAPEGLTNDAYLEQLCLEGLARKWQLPHHEAEQIPQEEYHQRLKRELDVIRQMGFTDYFLIVWDFIRFAHSQHIMVGPGRGSGAGSLAAYCLGITNIDPLRYGLIFERFLNVDRVSMPDFDIDFCYERRSEVIDYVTEKYGQDHVAQVITFGTLAARACIRDVARALDVPYADTDRIAKMIPQTLGITIQKALDTTPDLRKAYEHEPITKEVIDTALRFEGMPRHASTHAAGVVIAGQPLTELAPLSRNDDAIVVQFAKGNVELIGLLKFDFLGLRTLTVLRDSIEMIRQNHGVTIDIEKIPLDDKAVYDMIGEGKTDGVFQLESSGMINFMKELQPEHMEDIIAGISLYRPGPMEQIPRYVAARHDPSLITYDHPLLEPILNVTYGCIVYQEQVMQIVRDLAGFSLAQADNVRRAMSKKKPAELAKYKNLFLHGGKDEKGQSVPGAVARGVSLAVAEKTFEDVMAFAGYAFNKSHAAAYALVAWQTAWFKYHYPVEFMAAMLNSYLGSLSQAALYVRACRKLGIDVLPPDINQSGSRFTTENGSIRFALTAVKNVGVAAIRSLIEEREAKGAFKSYGDFLRRMNQQDISRKMIESLIRASALDCFNIPRARLIAVLEPFTNQLSAARRQSMEGQMSLFEMSADKKEADNLAAEPVYPELPEFDRIECLAMEKDMLGLYISGHPLDAYDDTMRQLTTLDSSAFSGLTEDLAGQNETLPVASVQDGDRVIMAGMLISRKNKTTRSQEMMSFLLIEDLYGQFETIVFPKVLQLASDKLQEGSPLLIAGRISLREDEEPKLIAEVIELLRTDAKRLPNSMLQFHKRTERWQKGTQGSGGNSSHQTVSSSYSKGSGKSTRPGRDNSHAASMSYEKDAQPHASQKREDQLSNTKRMTGYAGDRQVSNESDSNVANDTVDLKTEDKSARRPVLWIRYTGRQGDQGYQQLLATLAYFQGETPVILYLPEQPEGQAVKPLAERFHIECSDEILAILATRYGLENLALR